LHEVLEWEDGDPVTPWKQHDSDRGTMMSEATVTIKPVAVRCQQHAANTWSPSHVAKPSTACRLLECSSMVYFLHSHLHTVLMSSPWQSLPGHVVFSAL